MFTKVLIANRGEIARRIILTLKKMDISSVAIFDDREKNSQYIVEADESYTLGEGQLSETFLNIEKILHIAKKSNCSAIHPGYGFLSENPNFAKRCSDEGIIFIGPAAETIEILGNKQKAVKLAEKLEIPVIPHIHGNSAFIINAINDSFYPCIIKASAGGGGKAMEIVHDKVNLLEALNRSAAESQRYFSSSEVFVERFLQDPRHVEVQILGDKAGTIIHLFERECSIQRRFQKIIEESPAPGLTKILKEALYKDARKIASEVHYQGAGTVEFLIDEKGQHFFLEMNTRIQVEHGVTELVTNIDIIEQQIKIAMGEELNPDLTKIKIDGHSIEARVYSEIPSLNYRPSSGRINLLNLPEKDFIRIDTDLNSQDLILTQFDALQAKIMVHGRNRDDAVSKLKFALSNSVLHGVKTNIRLLNEIVRHNDFIQAKYTTSFLPASFEALTQTRINNLSQKEILIASGVYLSLFHLPEKSLYDKTYESSVARGYWRIDKCMKVMLNAKEYTILLFNSEEAKLTVKIGTKLYLLRDVKVSSRKLHFTIESKAYELFYSWDKKNLNLQIGFDHRVHDFVRTHFLTTKAITFSEQSNQPDKQVDSIYAPLSGKIIRLDTDSRDLLSKGDNVLTIESMKMENDICMPFDGKIEKLFINLGDQVEEGQLLAGISVMPEN